MKKKATKFFYVGKKRISRATITMVLSEFRSFYMDGDIQGYAWMGNVRWVGDKLWLRIHGRGLTQGDFKSRASTAIYEGQEYEIGDRRIKDALALLNDKQKADLFSGKEITPGFANLFLQLACFGKKVY